MIRFTVKLFIVLIIVTGILILPSVSCSKPGVKEKKAIDPEISFKRLPINLNLSAPFTASTQRVFTVEIDSCEYIYVYWGNASWGAHKGNSLRN